MNTWRIAAVAAIGFALSQAASADPVIYTQAWTGTGDMYASQNDTAPGGFGNFGTAYDDFIFGAAQRVTDIHWTGGFFNGTEVPLNSFTVQFYADSGGPSGAAIYSATVTSTNTSLGNVGGFPLYNYDADLALDFLADANTRYWVSIVANVPFPPQWGIATGLGGNGVGVQDFFGSRGPTSDLAFTLTGTAQVPEPGSLALVGLAILGLVGTSRRSAAR